jgi:hemerythrin-like metal-binding protein
MPSSNHELLLEMENLRQELGEVKNEKAALETFLEITNQHSNAIEEDLVLQKEEKAALEVFLEMANEHTDAVEEDLVRENERKIAGFMDALPVGVFVLDAKGKVDFCNQKALQLLGKKSINDVIVEQFIKVEQLSDVYQLYVMGTEQLYPVSNLPSVCALYGESGSVEDIEIHRPDNTIPIEVWGVPIWDKKGQVTHAITAFMDITERKQAEAERERFTRELEALNASLDKKVAERTAQLKKNNELIRQVFGRYLTDEIVNALLETESGLALGGERREITILTSDLRGFTAQANQLPSEQVIKILNIYLKIMAEVITQYQGTINAFIGDGILVLFGAPILREGDHERAVACAVAMQLAMETVNNQIEAWGFALLEMGIGINTGEAIVGNVGSEKRTQYSAIGNEVNLAYRIESYTVGGQIFISESTLKKVGDIVKIRYEKQVKPKGIKQPITIYEVEGIAGEYNLYVSQEEEDFIPLWEEIPLQYTVLEDKHVGDKMQRGHLLKVSAKGALIRCHKDLFPEPLDNLEINLIIPGQSVASEDIYAKVLSREVDENILYVRFTTNLSASIKAQLLTFYKFEWTPDLSINHPTIDEQHQQIFIKLNELLSSITHAQKEGVTEFMRFLEVYVLVHFEAEEKLMKQCHYPDYMLHKLQHSDFINNINMLKQEYEQTQKAEFNLYLALKIQHTLANWLVHHIGESDQQLGIFLKECTSQINE